MQKGRGMHEFNCHGEFDGLIHRGIAEMAAGKGQHRAQALAAGINQMFGTFRNQRNIRSDLADNELVHPLHAGGDETHQGFDAGRSAMFFLKW